MKWDNYCQKCNVSFRNKKVQKTFHHILPLRHFPYSPLSPLCRSCHNEIERRITIRERACGKLKMYDYFKIWYKFISERRNNVQTLQVPKERFLHSPQGTNRIRIAQRQTMLVVRKKILLGGGGHKQRPPLTNRLLVLLSPYRNKWSSSNKLRIKD